MYGKRCNAIIWNDTNNSARRPVDVRSRFVANYIFDDGFSSLEECKNTVPEPEKWAFVRFCGNWYAVNMYSYHSLIVVSKDFVYTSTYKKYNRSYHERYAREDYVYPSSLREHYAGDSEWRDGIFQDLRRITDDIVVVKHNNIPYQTMRTIKNTIIVVKTEG